jgi:transcriptional regulator with XRE-family HTH domain
MEKPTLAEYLKEARERAGISQRQLANRVGIHHSYLARLESGEHDSPSAELLQNIADILEIGSTDLLGFIGVKPPQGLPELAPYLRAKYQMDDAAIRKLTVYMRRLTRDRNTNT